MRALLLIPGMLLLLSGTAQATSVGVTAAVNQNAVGSGKTLYLGDDIIHDEKIVTDANGLLQILLADGTSFTVGPNSSLTIDSFVYDPDAGTAQIAATLGKGVFRFIGGLASKSPGGVALNTPVGTVGILGGISNLDFSGAQSAHLDMVYGQGVTLKDGTTVIGDVHKNGYSIIIDPNGKVTIKKTPPEWLSTFQSLMAGQGSDKSVEGAKVADTLTTTNHADKPKDEEPGAGNPNGQVGPNGPVSTWKQIDNSNLAGVKATYLGTYSADFTITQLKRDFSVNPNAPVQVSSVEDNAFGLQFDFASAKRSGYAYFGLSDDPTKVFNTFIKIPVKANDPTGSGPAGYGFHADFANGKVYGDLDGLFLNTPNGTANGTAGIFDAGVNLSPILAALLLQVHPVSGTKSVNAELSGAFKADIPLTQ